MEDKRLSRAVQNPGKVDLRCSTCTNSLLVYILNLLSSDKYNEIFTLFSALQGLGLFAARDLEKHTMVIEYIGYLIRNEVANRTEVVYEEQVRNQRKETV